jgi:hypothetical protein
LRESPADHPAQRDVCGTDQRSLVHAAGIVQFAVGVTTGFLA